MRRSFFIFLAMVAGLIGSTGTAFAGFADVRIDPAKDRAGFLSENTFRRLEGINAQIDRGEPERGIEGMERLLKQHLQPFERAVVLRSYANILLNRDDQLNALARLEEALKLDSLSMNETISLLYLVAQLHAAQENYEETIGYLDLWRPLVKDIPPEAHMLATAAFSSLQRFPEAEREIRAAMGKVPEPKEQWYQLLLALLMEQKKRDDAAATLLEMIRLWPAKADYPKQLASLYAGAEREIDAVAVYEYALAAGFLTSEKELLQLAGLYLFIDVPLKAAKLLERSLQTGAIAATMPHYEALGNAWLRAQEPLKAIDAFRRASSIAPSPKSDLLAAQMLLDLERWDDAVQTLEHIVQSPDFAKALDNPGLVFMLMGSAHFEARRLEQAREAFTRGLAFPRVKDNCESWIQTVDAELARLAHEAQAH